MLRKLSFYDKKIKKGRCTDSLVCVRGENILLSSQTAGWMMHLITI